MILKVKFKKNHPFYGIRTMRLAEVIRQETPDGRDIHAVFESEAFKENETLCEGFFLPETNAEVLTPEMQNLLDGMETIELPATIKKLRPNTFEGCGSLIELDIPEGIDSIPEKCFKDCEALKYCNTPDTVVEMGPSAFENCISLVNITLPDGMKSISYNCFKNCKSLLEVNIPSSVKVIGSSAFSDCDNLNIILLPNGLLKINGDCFSNCCSLNSINFPDSVKEIGRSAFQDCKRLSFISLPAGIEMIPSGCFEGCTNLEEAIIPSSVKEIGDNSFEGCSKLRSVLLPDGVKLIGHKCFKDCLSLDEIFIPDSVIKIGENVFENCSNLRSATLPTRMKDIAEKIFTGDCHPETINYVSNDTYILEDNLLLSKDGKTLIKYQKSDQKEFIVPGKINKINEDAFAESYINGPEVIIFLHRLDDVDFDLEWRGVKKIQIVDDVFLWNIRGFFKTGVPIEVIDTDHKIIGRFIAPPYRTTFDSIAKYDEYLIGKGVYSTPDKEEKIETFLTRLDYPFELGEEVKQNMIAYVKTNKKEALQWIFQNSRFEELQNNAQYLLTKFNIDQIIELATNSNNPGLMAFLLNFKMNTLKMDPDKTKPLALTPLDPNSLREVQKDWILTGLNLPELTVSEYRGEQKSTLVLPTFAGKKPITRVGTHCNWLRAEEIIIPDGYRVIEESALMNKRAGKIIFMADSVVEIGAKAFAGADRLEEVRLSDRLTKIKDRTFEGCASLIKVNIPADLVSIGKAAFKICANLELLEISEKVTEIGKDAFADCPKLVIHAPKGSYAIEYARDNGIKYVEI
jgi:hypothetical protein